MKKILVLMSILVMSLSVNAAEEKEQKQTIPYARVIENKAPNQKIMRENLFERRLGLTEVQKLKASQIRKNGHEKLKPVIDQIISKKQEAEMVRRSRMAIQMQEEKLTVIDSELKVLEKKANEIRKANMKEFESILTKEQKRILKQMKKEGRRNYHKMHPIGKHHIKHNGGFLQQK